MIVEIFMASLHFYILYQAGYHAYSLRFLLDVWFPLELFFFFGGGDVLGGTIENIQNTWPHFLRILCENPSMCLYV